MAEQNDARAGFFAVGQNAIMITIEQAEDGLVGGFPVAVFEHLDVGSAGQIPANALRQLDWTVIGIVVTDESTGEANDNVGVRGRMANDGTLRRK